MCIGNPQTQRNRDSMLRGHFCCGSLFSVLCITEFSGARSVSDHSLVHLRLEAFAKAANQDASGPSGFAHRDLSSAISWGRAFRASSHTAKWVPVITLWGRRGCCCLETHVLECCASEKHALIMNCPTPS